MRASWWQLIRFAVAIVKQLWKMVKESRSDFRENDVRVWLRNPIDLRRALRKALVPEFKEFLSIVVDHQKLFRERMEEAGVKLNLGVTESTFLKVSSEKGQVEYKIRPYPFYQDATWDQIELSLLMSNLRPAGIDQMVEFRRKYNKELYLDPVFFYGAVRVEPDGAVRVPYVQNGQVSLGLLSKDTIKSWPCWILVMLRDQHEFPEVELKEEEFGAIPQ